MRQIGIIGVVILLNAVVLQAQPVSISLDSCIQWANEAQKFAENRALIRDEQVLSMENTNKMNLPVLTLDGTATYQNENITIDIPVPGFDAPNVPLNFNRLLVTFNQTIYNGRLAAHKKMIDSLTYNSKAYQLEVDKIKLKSKITGIYSSIVLVKEQRQIMDKQLSTVEAKVKNLEGAIAAGVGYKSDLLNLQAEVLKLKQSATDLEYLERALRMQLANLTGHDIPETATFALPQVAIVGEGVEARPELKLINSQRLLLNRQVELSAASRMPYIGIFGSAGVGYPGYDIFNSSVRPMLMIGLKVNWTIFDWQKSKNDRQLLNWNAEMLTYQYDRARLELESELIKTRQEIAKYEELITRDKEIVAMRKEITQQTSARLSSGTATSTDFLIQLNNEAVAELNESIHKIKLDLARLTYQIIQGK